MNGNWVINKNNRVSFCAVGADNALVYLNHSMKVSGGLVGIAQNESAQAKFFLIVQRQNPWLTCRCTLRKIATFSLL